MPSDKFDFIPTSIFFSFSFLPSTSRKIYTFIISAEQAIGRKIKPDHGNKNGMKNKKYIYVLKFKKSP